MKVSFVVFIGILSCINLPAQKQTPNGLNGKYATILGKSIYYEEYGKGPALILLQGGLKSIKDFSPCIPELSKKFRIIAPDDPGQGRSQALDTLIYDLLAEYVSKLIDELKLDSAYVLGWSDGGIAALILAAKRPDKVKRVIAVGANYAKSGYVSSGNSEDTLQLIPPDYQPPAEDQKWIDGYFIANKAIWKKIMNDRKIMWAQEFCFPKELFNEMKVPILIVSGDHDIIRLSHTVEMHQLIKGSQLCVLPNTSHDVFSSRPGLVSSIVTDFLMNQ